MADEDLSDDQLKQLLKDAELRLREAKQHQTSLLQESLPHRVYVLFAVPVPEQTF